jgi:uridine kinase
VGVDILSLESVKVVIAEGTYVSLLRHVDARVFIARNRLETLEHRRKRNRGSEAADPFIEGVLGVEHKIIAGHKNLADFVLSRDFQVVRGAQATR